MRFPFLFLAFATTALAACQTTDSPSDPAHTGGEAGTSATGGQWTGGGGGQSTGGSSGATIGGSSGATIGGSSGATTGGGAGPGDCPATLPYGPCTQAGAVCDYSFPLTCPPGCSGGDFHRMECLSGEWTDTMHTAGVPECYCPPGVGGAGGAP